MNVVVLTGVSGSGKSTALKALEDLGFFCIDNLPFALLPTFLELVKGSQEPISKVAILIDLRSGNIAKEQFSKLVPLSKAQGFTLEVVLLEASDEEIKKRFQQTRRRHYFSHLTMDEALAKERKTFEPIYQYANLVVDTSDFNVHELRDYMHKHFKQLDSDRDLKIQLISFGYSFGVPSNVDLVMDVRFLPNPYFQEGLKELTGADAKVIDFITAQRETQGFMERFEGLLDYVVPLYQSEGKSYLSIGVGCTGGRHRSVAICELLKNYFSKKKINVVLKHRDVQK
ncbi:MAG: RNase adapter RapZ [Deltaproteobacteria bacterium]|nr:RNase adapter RapZ [Deltaproteobacteria bacterium]